MKKKLFTLVILLTLFGTSSLIEEIHADKKNQSKVESEYPWTTWSRKVFAFGLKELLDIRVSLTKNLFDTFKKLPEDIICPDRAKYARMEDGTCNDLDKPAMGSAGIAFGRNIPLKKITYEEEEGTLFDPDPRLISKELLGRDVFKPVPFLNFLVTSWLQFMNHDWFFHGENEHPNPYILDIKEGDYFHGQKSMMVLRTRTDMSKKDRKKEAKKAYANTNTHWWDGSQIYGSSLKTLKTLRTYQNGELKIGNSKLLPLDKSDNMELTGFKDNWWVGLSMLHSLFVLEHNAIAQHLKKRYPKYSDQELFDKARLINAAAMAKIHAIEWTPAILNNPMATLAMKSNWYGPLNPQSYSHSLGRFKKYLPNKTNWGIFDHPYLGGVVGGSKNLRDVPYTLTEEFVAVYRMHPLLPEFLDVRDYKDGELLKSLPLAKTRKEKSPKVTKDFGMNNLFYSFGVTHPGAMTLNNYPNFLRNLDMPIVGKMDLAAVDIIRDRERGIPRYNEFRRSIAGLKPIRSFEDLFLDPSNPESQKTLEKLKRIYRNDIEKLDLLVGSLAEETRPTGFGFGETAFHIFIAMAPRRFESDRFFTTDYRPEIYTEAGMKWLDNVTMKSVILRHHPELKEALSEVKDDNAFFPWKKR